jgi:cytochrome c
MDSFELNKLLGGLLGAVFIVFSVSLLSDAIFASPAPERPGFLIEAPEVEAGAGPAAPQEDPIAVRLASADIGAGETAYRKCQACHTIDEGGANRVGPNLWDIVNRPIAGHEGFAYSGAMREFSEGGTVVWDYDHLDHFLTSPRGLVRGTAMSFAGIRNPAERADLIAYMRTLSNDVAPLPEAPAGDAAEAPAEDGAEAPAEAPATETPAEEEAETPAETPEVPATETPEEPVEEEEAPAPQ